MRVPEKANLAWFQAEPLAIGGFDDETEPIRQDGLVLFGECLIVRAEETGDRCRQAVGRQSHLSAQDVEGSLSAHDRPVGSCDLIILTDDGVQPRETGEAVRVVHATMG